MIIFTDGSSRGNPGPGGWAFIAWDGHNVYEEGGREDVTTNNRMEMMAVGKALSYLKQKNVSQASIHTDSAYVINGITKWLPGWQKNNWQTKTKEPVKNEDLWRMLAELVEEIDITWVRVSGHAGVPGNERVDEIATAFADGLSEKLYHGSYEKYGKDLSVTKSAVGSKAKKDRSSRKGTAYSYVSAVNGKVMVHKTWAECEARVKGVSGARFKKALSKIEESEIIKNFS